MTVKLFEEITIAFIYHNINFLADVPRFGTTIHKLCTVKKKRQEMKASELFRAYIWLIDTIKEMER